MCPGLTPWPEHRAARNAASVGATGEPGLHHVFVRQTTVDRSARQHELHLDGHAGAADRTVTEVLADRPKDPSVQVWLHAESRGGGGSYLALGVSSDVGQPLLHRVDGPLHHF